jgi:hypothetical protein
VAGELGVVVGVLVVGAGVPTGAVVVGVGVFVATVGVVSTAAGLVTAPALFVVVPADALVEGLGVESAGVEVAPWGNALAGVFKRGAVWVFAGRSVGVCGIVMPPMTVSGDLAAARAGGETKSEGTRTTGTQAQARAIA